MASLVGSRQPGYSLPDLQGTLGDERRFAGRVVLLNFWATWCPPCREELPALAALRERLAGRGFEVVGIAVDDHDEVRDFLATLSLSYPQLVAGSAGLGLVRAYGDEMGVLPYSVLVDRAGAIRAQIPGVVPLAEIEGQILGLLAETAPTATPPAPAPTATPPAPAPTAPAAASATVPSPAPTSAAPPPP
jgi:thiol-disulfide isomerase/thioredoxin